jgi:hypothetical protein
LVWAEGHYVDQDLLADVHFPTIKRRLEGVVGEGLVEDVAALEVMEKP